jgi:tRNA threonylcarbamoyl adenosine modification protein (Sua5/YciO/YrdC/YwlC family)
VPNIKTARALSEYLPDAFIQLAETYWPGALTMIVRAQPSLTWDLGETKGTVALRMPDHKIALALLEETGPLAVSSANLTGEPATTTSAQAEGYLADAVEVFLDGGPSPKGEASTILDLTALRATSATGAGDGAEAQGKVRIVRRGALSAAKIRAVIGDLLEDSDN